MAKQNGSTEIIFVMDRSGSMNKILTDTIGGFNQFIADQKKVEGDCKVTFIQFDHEYEPQYLAVPLNEVAELTTDTFKPRGWTALHDAMGLAIQDTQSRHDTQGRPDNVIFITVTDGEENKSTEFTAELVKKLVEFQKDKYKWEFIFLGANQDAVLTARNLGIGRGQTMTYAATPINTERAYDSISHQTRLYRAGEEVAFSEAERAMAVADDDEGYRTFRDNLTSSN